MSHVTLHEGTHEADIRRETGAAANILAAQTIGQSTANWVLDEDDNLVVLANGTIVEGT